MSDRTLAAWWDRFERDVQSRGGPVPPESARIAFYQGALALFNILMRSEPEPATDAEGVQLLRDLDVELQAFTTEISLRDLPELSEVDA